MRRRRINFRLTERGALVRLPPVFPLCVAFRKSFPRALPMRPLYSFLVPGPAAMARVGTFDADHGDKAVVEIRRRERARDDAEWEAGA